MLKITLKKLHIENFKGCKERDIVFSDKTIISGQNASGKTTIVDAFSWLLFNTDSKGNTKFDIRPLNENGKPIDYINIVVEATISSEDNEYVFKKVQKQKWVKHRGTTEKTFEGNVNEFEINGYPKSEKEFSAIMSDIVEFDTFKMLSNAMYFNNLDWKEQRKILMKMANKKEDSELAKILGFEKLVPELKIASTDDMLNKYKKTRNKINEKLKEIPARIDEVRKNMSLVDISDLELQKKSYELQLKRINDELISGNSTLDEIKQKQSEIMELRFDMNNLVLIANQGNTDKIKKTRDRKSSLEENRSDVLSKIRNIEHEISYLESDKNRTTEEKNRLLALWKSTKHSVFREFVPLPAYQEPIALTDKDFTCPTCKQKLPKEVIEKRISEHELVCRKTREEYEEKVKIHKESYEKEKNEFEEKRTSDLKSIEEKGKLSASKIKEYEEKIASLKDNITELRNNIPKIDDEIVACDKILASIPSEVDMSGNEEYKSKENQIESLENEIKKLSENSSGRVELMAQSEALNNSIKEIDNQILLADNTKNEERIRELEDEMTELGQKMADQDNMIVMIEDFVRSKMNNLSSEVNKYFEGNVSWKLFSEQVNGGLKETCECTINGVPYSDLNDGHKIIAGLHICKALGKFYSHSVPVFVDNSESVNDFNLPEVDYQIVLLKVSDDKELKVEKGE